MSLDLSLVCAILKSKDVSITTSELDPLIKKLNAPELEKLQALIRELGKKSGPPLSKHRVQVNEGLVVSMLTKYHSPKPPAARSEEEILTSDITVLTKIKTSSGQSSEEVVATLKKGLSEKTFHQLCYYLGIVVNLPKRTEEVYDLLRKDASILGKEFPPLICGTKEATIIDQLVAALQQELPLAALQQDLQLAELQAAPLLQFHQLYHGGGSHDEVKRALDALPEQDRNAILDSLGKSDRITARAAFDTDPTELVGHIPYNALITSLNEKVDSVKEKVDALKEKINAEKQEIFKQWYAKSHMTNRQLKALYKMIPGPVALDIPRPPYYGKDVNSELYKTFGAHYDPSSKMTTFTVYAPKAQKITLVLTAFLKTEHRIELTCQKNGVWKVETDLAKPGRTYTYEIVGEKGGRPFMKLDPFGFGSIVHDTAQVDRDVFLASRLKKEDGQQEFIDAANGAILESVVRDIHEKFDWEDQAWLETRKKTDLHKQPFNAYELHPLIKRKPSGHLYNWREIGKEMAPYLKQMGYTHVEVLGAFDHPSLASWGYQVTGYFTPTSRFGTLDDFKAFVNEMHKAGIGVILDWVPAHFSRADRGMQHFDGSNLFEDSDPRFEDHPTWGSKVFDYAKPFVRDFLISSPLFFFREFHIDGLRVDAVTSMMKLTFDRSDWSRISHKGSPINPFAKDILRDLNALIKREFPGTITIAEEYENYPNLTGELGTKQKDPLGRYTKPKGGIGFDFIWDMPFHNQLFKYIELDQEGRNFRHGKFCRKMGERHPSSDKVVSAFSHDESANEKLALPLKPFRKSRRWVCKIGGSSDRGQLSEVFANVRLMIAMQIAHKGKKLNLMGNEFGQTEEWSWRLLRSLVSKDDPVVARKVASLLESLDPKLSVASWDELETTKTPTAAFHQGVLKATRDLNHLYLTHEVLWDDSPEKYTVFHDSDKDNQVIGIHRMGKGKQLAFMFNFSDHVIPKYDIPLPSTEEMSKLKSVKELLNTDCSEYGGSNMLNNSVTIIRDSGGKPTHMRVKMPAYSCLVLEESLA